MHMTASSMPRRLASWVTAATGHRSQITDPEVRRAVGAVDALPSHPDIHTGLVEVLDSDRATADHVAGLAGLDTALSLKRLLLGRSYLFFGRIEGEGALLRPEIFCAPAGAARVCDVWSTHAPVGDLACASR